MNIFTTSGWKKHKKLNITHLVNMTAKATVIETAHTRTKTIPNTLRPNFQSQQQYPIVIQQCGAS